MVAKQDRLTPETIIEVFRELGLEDEKARDEFLKLSKVSDWSVWQEGNQGDQDTRGNTALDVSSNDA